VKSAWIALIERRNLETAAAVHVTSQLEADELAAFRFNLTNICIVPNGVDLLSEGPLNHKISSAIAEIVAGSPYLLFLGRINWKKGLDRLIAALELVPQVRLIVAGNDEEGYQATLEALAESHGVTDRILFAGPVYGEDKRILFTHAAALITPSYSENFGNVVLEAMAAGCPVITTPEVGAAEIVRESGAGLVVNGNFRSLASGITQLIQNPESMSAMRTKGPESVVRHYTWDAVAKRTETAYLSVLQHSIQAIGCD
jgi:glycosyltransferase involved in cell wall biosynthesis